MYYWDMSYARMFGVLVCRCDLSECGRVWIAEKVEMPRRCARCKSTKWDEGKPSTLASERLKPIVARNTPVVPEVPEDDVPDEPIYVRDEYSQD
jgi:hypothetical protein